MPRRIEKSNLFISLIILFFLFGCTCSNEISKKEEANTKPQSNLPEGTFLKIPNKSNTFILMIENQDGKEQIITQKRFYVYDKTKDEIILDDFIPSGKVFWKNDTEIQVEKYPGMISKNESENTIGYSFNTTTREKTEIK